MIALRYYLWVAPHLLLGLVLLLLSRRGLSKRIWLFRVYLVLEILLFAALFTVNWIRMPINYYHLILVAGSSASDLVKFGLIYQLGRELIAGRSNLMQGLRSWSAFFFGVFAFCAVIASATLPRSGVSNTVYIFRIMDLSSSVIMVGLLLAYLLFMRIVGVSWRDWAFGLILGFGVFETASLISAALRPLTSSSGSIIVDCAEMAAYHVCVLIWLIYLLRAEPAAVLPASDTVDQSHLEFWGREIQRMIQ